MYSNRASAGNKNDNAVAYLCFLTYLSLPSAGALLGKEAFIKGLTERINVKSSAEIKSKSLTISYRGLKVKTFVQ
jgi:hypothetical protein